MTGERESQIQIEVIRAEQEPLKKFKMYFGYLKDKFRENGDLKNLHNKILTFPDLTVYQKYLSFVRSLSADNCNMDYIIEELSKLHAEAKNCNEMSFKAWIRNEMGSFLLLKGETMVWEGEDGIKQLVDSTLYHVDPENLF
ncbi:MAG: hypothetical protein WCV83_03200 [Candidatus Magasanikbacteria bacterium]